VIGGLPPAPTRDELVEHLVATRIAGEVDTPRGNNLRNVGLCVDRAANYTFGLELDRPWTHAEVLALMAERVGISPDPDYLHGVDTIDPRRTVERLDAMAARLAQAVERRERVVVATGHPTGLLGVHAAIAGALATGGCQVLVAGDGERYDRERHRVEIRFVLGVGMVRDGGELLHTHAPEPMRTVLGALAARGEPPPDLVVADHGWCGAAGQAGIDCVGFADCNDPALFVGEAEGKIAVVVPLDDNVRPALYDPMTAYLLDRLR
jgi:hypothetical protein